MRPLWFAAWACAACASVGCEQKPPPTTAAAAPAPTPYTHTSPAGYTVTFPAKPNVESLKGAAGEPNVEAATLEYPKGHEYMASATPVTLPPNTSKPKFLQMTQDTILAEMAAKVDESKVTAFGPDGLPARTFTATDRDHARLRITLVYADGVVFNYGVIGPAAFTTGPEAEAFLKSFQVVPAK